MTEGPRSRQWARTNAVALAAFAKAGRHRRSNHSCSPALKTASSTIGAISTITIIRHGSEDTATAAVAASIAAPANADALTRSSRTGGSMAGSADDTARLTVIPHPGRT